MTRERHARVLIATDLSEHARNAALLAARLARPGARFRVLHVGEKAATSRALVERLAEDAGLASADVVAHGGSAAREIAREADAWRADLVALGARGHSIAERFLGSTADAVLDATSCDVLLARGVARRAPAPAVERVAVATDLYAASRAAAERALAIAQAEGAEISVVHAIDREPFVAIAAGHGFHVPGLAPVGSPRELEAAMRALLSAFNEQATGAVAREVVAFGKPAEAIRRYATQERVDLLVAGAQGSLRGSGRVVGSVGHALAERAPCSVLLCRGR